MRVQELQPQPESRRRFAYPELTELPATAGCYILATVDDYIVYIGQSDNIATRVAGHFNNPEKRAATSRGVAFWCYYGCTEKLKLNAMERGWLNQYEITEGKLPHFNKQRAPV